MKREEANISFVLCLHSVFFILITVANLSFVLPLSLSYLSCNKIALCVFFQFLCVQFCVLLLFLCLDPLAYLRVPVVG